MNTLVIFTITVAGPAHEPQKERDLSAVFIGDTDSGSQTPPASDWPTTARGD